MNKILAGIILLLYTAGCNPSGSEKKLPILGRMEVNEKEVNGQIVKDTTYHTIPSFSFVNQDSTIITENTFEGKIYIADFFFSTCPDICPTMKTQMLRVYEAYKDEPDLLILSHTIDPEYDTVGLLYDFADRLGVSSNKWHFVTGDKDTIYEIGQKSYMVSAREDPNAPGGYMHSGAFILIDTQKRIRGYYDGTEPESVDQLIKDIKVLLKENV